MSFQTINGVPVWGEPLANAVDQITNCVRAGAYKAALMADHHLGYAVPIGGVLAYRDKVSPSAVGFDIACGNKAVCTDARIEDIKPRIKQIMDDVWRTISFGVGRKNREEVDHALFHDDPAWLLPAIGPLKDMARGQLGTCGSGNHYCIITHDEQGRVWVANHFGSRGLGHKIATHYLKAAGGKDGMNVDPAVLDVNTDLGREYLAGMALAGRYAYAGRDWVVDKIVSILGATITQSIHVHHNYSWQEDHGGESLWVVRKGATPLFHGQQGFIGATMAEPSAIVEGISSSSSLASLCSGPHGAGRAMSRSEAAGKVKWIKGVKTRIREGKVSQTMMDEWVHGRAGVELRGAGLDESPHCYKRLDEVLAAHSDSIRVLHWLTPIGVAMAGEDDVDPYKD